MHLGAKTPCPEGGANLVSEGWCYCELNMRVTTAAREPASSVVGWSLHFLRFDRYCVPLVMIVA
jgi:hypothetical protein